MTSSSSLSNVKWECKRFSSLNGNELYGVLKLRNEVFIVEQNCVYLDIDDKDKNAYHVMGWFGDEIIATSRLLDKGVSYDDYVSIGRVATSLKYRRLGYGKKLVDYSIEQCRLVYGASNIIKISAQLYLKKFYSEMGFEQIGDEYMEDEIPHIPMILRVF